jgi:hypothetical protein
MAVALDSIDLSTARESSRATVLQAAIAAKMPIQTDRVGQAAGVDPAGG